jgi:hypothetical protein
MDKQYSGNMIVELMGTVGQVIHQVRHGAIDSEHRGIGIDAEQRANLIRLRDAIVNNGRETSPLKTAWLSMIDQCLCDSPSAELIFAAMKDVDRLAPANSNAIGISLI